MNLSDIHVTIPVVPALTSLIMLDTIRKRLANRKKQPGNCQVLASLRSLPNHYCGMCQRKGWAVDVAITCQGSVVHEDVINALAHGFEDLPRLLQHDYSSMG